MQQSVAGRLTNLVAMLSIPATGFLRSWAASGVVDGDVAIGMLIIAV
jgi:hypothetical protein